MTQTDPYGDWDAAYVLGALTVQQRHEYEDHLAGCPDCRNAVGDLAAMPGLLAQLPAAEAIALSDRSAAPDSEPVPDSIRGLTPPRRFGLRARLMLVAAVVAALVIGGIGGFLVRGVVEPSQHHGTSTVVVAFAARQPTGVIADATLTPEADLTRIHFNCMYALHPPNKPDGVDLALVSVDDHGRKLQLWKWWAGPGESATWPGSAPVALTRLRSLQIVDTDSGAVVLTAAVK